MARQSGRSSKAKLPRRVIDSLPLPPKTTKLNIKTEKGSTKPNPKPKAIHLICARANGSRIVNRLWIRVIGTVISIRPIL